MKLTKDNYKNVLKGISVIEVSGESCANCLTLMPILNRLVKEIDDCELHHLEAEESTMDLITEFQIETVPTILVMNDDKIFARCKGFQPEEILELWLEAKVNDLKDIKKNS